MVMRFQPERVRERDRLRRVIEGDEQPEVGAEDLGLRARGHSLLIHRHLAGSPPGAGPDRPRHVACLEFDPDARADQRHREEPGAGARVRSGGDRPTGRDLAEDLRDARLEATQVRRILVVQDETAVLAVETVGAVMALVVHLIEAHRAAMPAHGRT